MGPLLQVAHQPPAAPAISSPVNDDIGSCNAQGFWRGEGGRKARDLMSPS